jgi:hypothetical protein
MKLALPHDCLVVFIDETGHELLSDPVQKVFGLGGCAILASRLENDLRAPWCKVREVVGGKANAQLHAAEITTLTSEQIDEVSSFFRLHPFARFGAICSVETSLVVSHEEMQGYRRASLRRACCVVNRQLTGVALALRGRILASTSRRRLSLSGIRCDKHMFDKTASSISAMFSQLPCLGV